MSVEFSRQEYWSRLPCPSPGDLPDPGIKPESPALAGGFLNSEPPGKHLLMNFYLSSCVFVSRNKAAILGCVTGALISVRWSLWNRISHWTVLIFKNAINVIRVLSKKGWNCLHFTCNELKWPLSSLTSLLTLHSSRYRTHFNLCKLFWYLSPWLFVKLSIFSYKY